MFLVYFHFFQYFSVALKKLVEKCNKCQLSLENDQYSGDLGRPKMDLFRAPCSALKQIFIGRLRCPEKKFLAPGGAQKLILERPGAQGAR